MTEEDNGFRSSRRKATPNEKRRWLSILLIIEAHISLGVSLVERMAVEDYAFFGPFYLPLETSLVRFILSPQSVDDV